VDDKLNHTLEFNSHCEPMDVLDDEDWNSNVKYLESDLFSMIYFLSEIEPKKKQATPFFNNLFSNAKAGSLFLFLDNGHTYYYEWFDQLIAGHGIEVLKSPQEYTYIHDLDEQKSDYFQSVSGLKRARAFWVVFFRKFTGDRTISHTTARRLRFPA
jgi:hypothetical protein